MMVYLSGRITGNKKWKEQFQEAEDFLLKLGFEKEEICNPLHLAESVEKTIKNPSYMHYMTNDIKHLMRCTDIYMLRGWWRSKGARLERHIAKVLGLEIIYQRRGDK